MNIRKSILTVAAAGLALSLAACGGPAPTQSASPGAGTTAAETPSTAPTESSSPTAAESTLAAAGSLTVWVDENRIDAFKTIGAEFTKETGVDLKVVQKPSADIKTDFVAQAPTGQGPDLIVGAHDWTGELVKNGVIAPVELGDAAKGFTDVAVRGFTNGGQLYGVPYAIENIALVRNNKLAKDTPTTFDALVTQGAKLTPAFPVLIQQGENGDAYHLYPLQTSFGAPVFKADDKGDYTADLGMKGPEGAKFAEYLKKLADQKVLSVATGGDQAKQAFLDGKSAYMITGPWWTGDFAKAGMDISVLPVPSAGGQPSAPFVGVQGVYLSSKSENALLANQFLTYMAGKDVQTKIFELAGRVPANAEAATAVTDPIMKGFAEAGAAGQPMPAIPEMGAVWQFWGGAEVSIISGKAAPAAAWAAMIKNIEGAF